VLLKEGNGWRLGWKEPVENAQASPYPALVGTNTWAIELTAQEFADFCRLALSLADTMQSMNQELMDEEQITCEQETATIWLEVSGFPHHYNLHFITLQGRKAEGEWPPETVPSLLQAIPNLKVF
jgi:Domain of unknown function (DUF1818)